jgi:4-amino-4-deoxy-L-arabinose transferase-like glycosyltransferase
VTTEAIARVDPGLEIEEPRSVPEPSARWRGFTADRWVLPVILLCGLIARLIDLTAVGLNSDEAVYAGQGGALFHVSDFNQAFSLFRAHPLLMQAFVGLVFRLGGPSDLTGRLVAVGFGLGAVGFTWAAARELYGPRVAAVAGFVAALVPYHVLVSRQVLVDTPLGCFTAMALFALARGVLRNRPLWIVAASLALGAATLSKETAVVFGPSALLVVLMARRRGRLRQPGLLPWCVVAYLVVMAPFPLTRFIGSRANAGSFVLWQITRAPNHPPDYFVRVLLQFCTPPVALLGLLGVLMLVHRRGRRDVILLLWILPTFAFYTLWPTKLFPYLFPMFGAFCIAVGLAVVAIFDAVWDLRHRRRLGQVVTGSVAAGCAVLLLGSTARGVTDDSSKTLAAFNDFDVEVQSFAGVREFARWAGANTPAGSRFMTIGPCSATSCASTGTATRSP